MYVLKETCADQSAGLRLLEGCLILVYLRVRWDSIKLPEQF